MTTLAFVDGLLAKGIEIWEENELLRCRAPEGVLTQEDKENLRAYKDELLRLLRGDQVASGSTAAPDADRYRPFPLTDLQGAYLVGRSSGMELGNTSCHAYWEVDSRNLDLERLENAWQRVLERHEMLRAVIRSDGTQRILNAVPQYRIATTDFRALDEDERERALAAVRGRMSHAVAAADSWPLFDICASRLDDETTRLFLSFDLIIADAWSLLSVLHELGTLYYDPDKTFGPVEYSFRDFVLKEYRSDKDGSFNRAREYWQSRFETLSPGPDLLLIDSPASIREVRCERLESSIERESWDELKTRATRSGMTPTGMVAAAFAGVLARWSQSGELTLNLTLFNRPQVHRQILDVVGDFSSTLLLETATDPRLSFQELAVTAQQQLLLDLDHGAMSGVQVVRELGQHLGDARRAAMPVVLTSNLIRSPADRSHSPLAALGEVVYGISQTPQVWLDHQVYEFAGRLEFNWDVVSGLFDPLVLGAMFKTYDGLLRELASGSEAWQKPLGDVLAGIERRLELEGPAEAIKRGSRYASQWRGGAAPRTGPEQPLPVAPEPRRTASQQDSSAKELALTISRIFREVLDLEVPPTSQESFFDLGATSVGLVRVQVALEAELGFEIALLDLFEQTTVVALARHLGRQQASDGGAEGSAEADRQAEAAGAPAAGSTASGSVMVAAEKVPEAQATESQDVAIIGMAGRFPRAPDLDQLWETLSTGVDCVTYFTDEELVAAGADPALLQSPEYVKSGYVLDDIDAFDAALFGISPRAAQLMDPQHRIFLEVTWSALEDAGYVPARYSGRIGVFASCRHSSYLRSYLPVEIDFATAEGFEALIGNDKDYLATRISHRLNLRGPSLSVQTACSSSLVAVHLATKCLRDGEAEMAVAGGVALTVPQQVGYRFQDGMVFSADGCCRPFDARAGGTTIGNGSGAVVLKRLKDAVRDRDHIYAVIKASAINNDGTSKVSYTAPSVEGQARVVADALDASGVDPATLSFIEAHGTGTFLGDPIEVEALTRAFRRSTKEKGFCALGSLKSNWGHMDTAAGVAGLIKAAFALKKGQLPPSLNFDQPNPKIDFANTPFFVSTTLRDLERRGTPLRAGVSAFGIGGTNAHVVLEEAPEVVRPADSERPANLLTISARTPQVLQELTTRYVELLSDPQNAPGLGDLCYTAQVGRAHHDHRLAVVADSREQMRHRLELALEGGDAQGVVSGRVDEGFGPKLAFLYSGQGPQHLGMGRELFDTQPVFRSALSRCAEIARKHLEKPLLDVIFGEVDDPGLLDSTAYSQPALFAFQYSLTEMWRSWGIEPSYTLGHSMGEFTAACVAGVFNLEDGMHLVAQRGRLAETQPPTGAMGIICASQAVVEPMLEPVGETVSMAAVNSPELVVISGEGTAVQKIMDVLADDGVYVKYLRVSHAFHCPQVEPFMDDYLDAARLVSYKTPSLGFVSCREGKLIEGDEASRPEHWAEHLRRTVYFHDALRTLQARGDIVYLEMGPDATLAPMGQRCFPEHERRFISSFGKDPDASDWKQVLEAAGKLYIQGIEVDRESLEQGWSRCRVPLPGYPFERKRFWVGEPARQEDEQEEQEARRLQAVFGDVIEAVRRHARNEASQVESPELALQEDCLNRLSIAAFETTLERLEAFGSIGEQRTFDEIVERLGVLPELRQHLSRVLDFLVDASSVGFDGELYWSLGSDGGGSVDELLQELAGMAISRPELVKLLERCCKSLGSILLGEQSARDLLFPDGSLDQIREVYEEAPVARYLNGVLAAGLRTAAAARREGQALRVLEVGAGVGSTTVWALPVLPPGDTSYIFSDISQVFLDEAAQRLAGYPFVTYRRVDVERGVAEQGLEPGSFDVVIAANVLHATRALHTSVAEIATLLRPGGMLLLREVTTSPAWFDLTVGPVLAEIDDELLRPGGHPFLTAEAWRTLLASHGFSRVEVIPGDDEVSSRLPEHLILAQRKLRRQPPGPLQLVAAGSGDSVAADRAGALRPPRGHHPQVIGRVLSKVPIYEFRISEQRFRSIRDHSVFDKVVLPGTFFLELADAVAREHLGLESALTLCDLSYAEPILFDDGESPDLLGQVILTTARRDSAQLEILSAGVSDSRRQDRWKVHVTGRVATVVEPEAGLEVEPLAAEEIETRFPRPVDVDELYSGMSDLGVHYGPAFRAMSVVLVGDGESYAEIERPEVLEAHEQGYRFHPAMLDSCLQSGMTALPLSYGDTGDERLAYMPVGVDKAVLFQPASERVCCHARFRNALPSGRDGHVRPDELPDVLVIDLDIWTAQGVQVAALRGVHLKRASFEALERGMRRDLTSQMYEIQWRETSLLGKPAGPAEPSKESSGSDVWLVLRDQTGRAAELIERLEKRGDTVVVVDPRSEGDLSCVVRKGEEAPSATSSSNALDATLGMLLGEGGRVRGLIDLAALDVFEEEPDDVLLPLRRICGGLLGSLQAIDRAGWPTGMDLILVTRGASAAGGSSPVSPLQASLSGIAESIRLEHPEIRCLRIDLDPASGADDEAGREIDTLLRHWASDGTEDQIAVRGETLLAPRLVPGDEQYLTEDAVVHLDPNATYLVTGGLGGIGLELAGWLVDRGARSLVLVSRSMPGTKRKTDALAALEQRGARVEIILADVSKRLEVERILDQIAKSMPPLKGVMHLAFSIEDVGLLELDWPSFERSLLAKAVGAWHLDRLTAEMGLDHLVIFSSLTSLISSPGQASYAAANAIVDSLAHARWRKGRPALVVNWGVWAEVGAVAEGRHDLEFLERSGIKAFPVARGLRLLESAMLSGAPQVIAVDADWGKLAEQLSVNGLPPLLRDVVETSSALVDEETSPLEEAAGQLLSDLQQGDEARRPELIREYLKQRIAELLKVRVEEIGDEQNLIQLGLDSLMFLTLVRRLGQDLSIKIVPHKAFADPTVLALGRRLLEGLGRPERAGAGPDEQPDRGAGRRSRGETGEAREMAAEQAIEVDTEHRFDPFPLTELQQAYWIGRDPEFGVGEMACHVYNEIEAGSLDVAALQRAWNRLVERHDQLRAIVLPDGRQQVMETAPEYVIRATDLRGCTEEEREKRLAEIREEMSTQAFAPDTWPLFDLRVSLVSDEHTRLHLDVDLLIADFYSGQLLQHELVLLYRQPDLELEPLELSFRDCVLAQIKARSSEAYKAAREYWLQRIDSLPPAPELPRKGGADELTMPQTRRRSARIEADAWQRLRTRSAQAGLTPTGMLCAAFAEVLQNAGAGDRFTINMTLFDRPAVHPQAHLVLGDFTSTILLELDCTAQVSFLERARDVQARLWEVLQYSQFSGVEVLRALAARREGAGRQIMPVVFTSGLGLAGSGQEGRRESLGVASFGSSQTPQVWLDCQVLEIGDELLIAWDVVEELFRPGVIDTIFEGYRQLLISLSS